MIEADRRIALTVGAFVVALAFAGGAVFIFVGAPGSWFAHRLPVQGRLPDASGLRPGARVQVAGVNVGTVSDLKLAPVGQRGVVVYMALSREGLRRLRADATVSSQTMGLLGDRIILIDPGRAEAPLLPGQPLPSRAPGGTDEIVAKAGVVADQVSTLVTRATALLDGFERSGTVENLAASSAALRRLSERAERGPGLLHAITGDATLPRDLRATTRGAARSVENLERATADVDAMTRSLSSAASQLEQVAAYVRSGRGTVGGLVYDAAIYENLRGIVGGINRSKILRALVRAALQRAEGAPAKDPRPQAVHGR